MAKNLSSLTEREFSELENELETHSGLDKVLRWAAQQSKEDVHPQYVADVITQDEFTHDVVVPYRNVFIVYDTT